MASVEEEDTSLASIGKGIYLSKVPIGNGTVPVDSQPTIILIFGWMGARLPHLLKYTKVYDELYPDAIKVVVRSEASSFWSSKRKMATYLAPVIEVLEASGCLPPSGKQQATANGYAPLEPLSLTPPPRILVHAFSNGGALQLITLSNILQERYEEANYPQDNLPPTAIILDSCPGSGGLQATQKAFLAAVRNPILRRLASAFITILYTIIVIMERGFGVKSSLTLITETLLRPRLLPWFSKATPRLYIYSKADDLVPFTAIEAHAESTRREGLEARLLRYDNSPHVAHARADPERYWGAIKQLWEDACRER